MVIILIVRDPTVDPTVDSTNYPNGKTLTKFSLHVHPQEFMYSVLDRLGAPVYYSSGPCLPACKKYSNRFWDYVLTAGAAGES